MSNGETYLLAMGVMVGCSLLVLAGLYTQRYHHERIGGSKHWTWTERDLEYSVNGKESTYLNELRDPKVRCLLLHLYNVNSKIRHSYMKVSEHEVSFQNLPCLHLCCSSWHHHWLYIIYARKVFVIPCMCEHAQQGVEWLLCLAVWQSVSGHKNEHFEQVRNAWTLLVTWQFHLSPELHYWHDVMDTNYSTIYLSPR